MLINVILSELLQQEVANIDVDQGELPDVTFIKEQVYGQDRFMRYSFTTAEKAKQAETALKNVFEKIKHTIHISSDDRFISEADLEQHACRDNTDIDIPIRILYIYFDKKLADLCLEIISEFDKNSIYPENYKTHGSFLRFGDNQFFLPQFKKTIAEEFSKKFLAVGLKLTKPTTLADFYFRPTLLNGLAIPRVINFDPHYNALDVGLLIKTLVSGRVAQLAEQPIRENAFKA